MESSLTYDHVLPCATILYDILYRLDVYICIYDIYIYMYFNILDDALVPEYTSITYYYNFKNVLPYANYHMSHYTLYSVLAC